VDDDKREGDGDAQNEEKKKSGSKDNKNDACPRRLKFMVGFWTRYVP